MVGEALEIDFGVSSWLADASSRLAGALFWLAGVSSCLLGVFSGWLESLPGRLELFMVGWSFFPGWLEFLIAHFLFSSCKGSSLCSVFFIAYKVS